MRVYCLVVTGVMLVSAWALPASALHEFEVWRSPFGRVHSPALNPTNGSVWACIGDAVYHYDRNHNLLSKTELWLPLAVAVNPMDGSCWVGHWGPQYNDEVIRLSAEGVETLRVAAPIGLAAVTGPDGSIWTSVGTLCRVSATGVIVVRVSGEGPLINLAANPGDGTCWVMDYFTGELLHMAPSGGILWQGGVYDVTQCWPALYYGDGTLWIAEFTSGDLVHLSQNAVELSRTHFAEGLVGFVVNQADGTCWVSPDSPSPSLVHVAADGSVLGSIARPAGWIVAVDPNTGTFWGVERERMWHADTDGTELWRTGESFGGVLFDEGVGRCWTWGDTRDLVCFDGIGGEVQRLPASSAFAPYGPSAVNPADGSVYFVSGEGATLTRVFRDGTQQTVSLTYAPTVTAPAAASGVAVDQRDDSFWAYVGDGPDGAGGSTPVIVHFGPDGTQLGSVLGLKPSACAVDAEDGSLWAVGAMSDGTGIAYFTPAGTMLWHYVQGMVGTGLSVDGSDGSCWVAGRDKIRHFAKDGTLLVAVSQATNYATAVAVDQHTGCCWAAQGSYVSAYDRIGRLLWQGDGFAVAMSLQVDSQDGSVWVNADTKDHVATAQGQIVHLWAPTTPFYDVLPGHWAGRAIRMCYEDGIVGGYPDGAYHPEYVVNRGQMAGFIARALAEGDANVPPGPETPHFPDVPADDWAYKYVEYAYANNIVAGYPNGLYGPEVPVDRGQMAAFIARAIVNPTGEAGLAGYVPPETPTFPDVPTDFWTYKHIEYIREAGIVGGYPDGLYHPENWCTRDQMAVFIARAFGLLPY